MPRDSDTTYRIMSAIKSADTEPERLLAQAMWKIGLRYRKHHRIPGKPDFVFARAKIAVFCDGDFWHGNNWRIRGLGSLEAELASYSDFWANKIRRNIQRDKQVTKQLEGEGWLVLRFWESDVRNSLENCAKTVLKAYQSRIAHF